MVTAGSYEELIGILRQRKLELDVSFTVLELIGGLASGHAAKILGPGPVHSKHLGPTSLALILGALGVRLALVEDPAAMARIRSRLVPRVHAGGEFHGVRHLRRPSSDNAVAG
jgi:hypothetical protein